MIKNYKPNKSDTENLVRKPSQSTIDFLLNYSKSVRIMSLKRKEFILFMN